MRTARNGLSNRRKRRNETVPAALSLGCVGVYMDAEGEKDQDRTSEVPLVPAWAVGFLLYPWAVQLILANPPANDAGQKPRQN